MILSPDKLSMPRYNPTTNEGRITGEIFQILKKENKEALGQLAGRLDREKEVRQTDLINELVIHELQKATLHGRHVNIDEGLVRRTVMSMIPEGKKEGDRFYEVITDFKKALDNGDFRTVNEIYEDPDQYTFRRPGFAGIKHLFESKVAPRYNAQLKNYLTTIVERRIADLLGPDPRHPGGGPSPANVTTFVDMFDGISRIMHTMTLDQIPIAPAAVTGNVGLQAQIHTRLADQVSSGARPKVYEALRLNLVSPGSINSDVDRVAREFAGRRGSEQMNYQTASAEEQGKVLSQTGTPTGDYHTHTLQPEAITPEQQRLLLLLDDSPKHKERFPRESEDQWRERMRQYHRLPDRLKNIENVVDAIQKEVFEPFAALTTADRATLTVSETALSVAQKGLDRARAIVPPTPASTADITRHSADIRRNQLLIDSVFASVSRMTRANFERFLKNDVKPILYQYLCNSLLEGTQYYKTMRDELIKMRTMPHSSYAYKLLSMSDILDPTFRDVNLAPIIRARLSRSAVPTQERQALIEPLATSLTAPLESVTTDAELRSWGL